MKTTKNKAIIYTVKKANSNNAIYNYYQLAKKMAGLYNKNQLSASDILNIK